MEVYNETDFQTIQAEKKKILDFEDRIYECFDYINSLTSKELFYPQAYNYISIDEDDFDMDSYYKGNYINSVMFDAEIQTYTPNHEITIIVRNLFKAIDEHKEHDYATESCCVSKRVAVFKLSTVYKERITENLYNLLDNSTIFESNLQFGDYSCRCKISNEFNVLHLFRIENDYYGENQEFYNSDELFLSLELNKEIKVEYVMKIMHFLLFKVNTVGNINLRFLEYDNPLTFVYEGGLFTENPDVEKYKASIHIDVNQNEFDNINYSLINLARWATNYEHKIWYYYQFYESMFDNCTSKYIVQSLNDNKVVNPQKKVKQLFSLLKSDFDQFNLLLQLNILTDEVVDLLPNELKVKVQNDNYNVKKINHISKYIYNARNQIVHAKSNYGKEKVVIQYQERKSFILLLDKLSLSIVNNFLKNTL